MLMQMTFSDEDVANALKWANEQKLQKQLADLIETLSNTSPTFALYTLTAVKEDKTIGAMFILGALLFLYKLPQAQEIIMPAGQRAEA